MPRRRVVTREKHFSVIRQDWGWLPRRNSKRLDGQLAKFAPLLESEWSLRFGVTPKLKPLEGFRGGFENIVLDSGIVLSGSVRVCRTEFR